jgi:hypothetical protein
MIAFTVLHLTHMPISANDYQDGEKAFISYQILNEPVVKIKKNFFTKTMYAYQNGVYTILKNKGTCTVLRVHLLKNIFELFLALELLF